MTSAYAGKNPRCAKGCPTDDSCSYDECPGRKPAVPCVVATPDEKRYRWLRENGDKGIFVIRKGGWKQGYENPPLELCQLDELDTVIDEHLSGER